MTLRCDTSSAIGAFEKTLTITTRLGLHARPAALLVNALRPFHSKIMVVRNGEKANAKSILGLLSLGAGYGTILTFIAAGVDATQALEVIEELFANGFEK